MAKKTPIVFAGWGTGGHIMPLISILKHLGDDQYSYVWLWERNSLEQEIAQKHNIEFHEIAAGKIRRYFDMRNLYEPLKNLTGIVESLYHLSKSKSKYIVSKWWFVAVPVVIAGAMLRKRIIIHESDTIMGLANKISARFAKKILYSFPNKKTQDPKNKKHIHVGAIMNPEMLDGITSANLPENTRLQVLVIAGSQGSKNIASALLKLLPDTQDIDFQVVLGTMDDGELQEQLQKFSNVTLHGFLTPKEIAKVYAMSDIAITRWSSLLWELYYFGIHAIIVPLKATGGDHQTKNAEFFHTHYGSDILEENDTLSLELFRKLQQYKDLRKNGLHLEWFLDGVTSITNEIEAS